MSFMLGRDLKAARHFLWSLSFRGTPQAQQTKTERGRMGLKRDLDVAREKLDIKTRGVDEANKDLQEANAQLKGLKDEVGP